MSDPLNAPVMYEMTSEQYAEQIREAEKRGAVKALRAEVEYFVGASTSAVLDESTRRTAQGAAAHLRSMAERIESGEVTL